MSTTEKIIKSLAQCIGRIKYFCCSWDEFKDLTKEDLPLAKAHYTDATNLANKFEEVNDKINDKNSSVQKTDQVEKIATSISI